jgi:hypothetical protein
MEGIEMQKRNTTKSRTIETYADAGIHLVTKGEYYFTKSELVAEITSQCVSQKAPVAMRTMFEAEAANLLDTYFKEIADAISEGVGLPYHFTSREFHRAEVFPLSEDEAREFVVCFGNGRRGKAHGLRFVTPEDEPDPMMLVATQKAMDVVKKALDTQVERLRKISDNPSLPLGARLKLRAQLPNLTEAARVANLPVAEIHAVEEETANV